MFGSTILDVACGLIFVYLLLGLLCSVLNEWIARLFALRASILETGIRNLLSGKGPDGGELAESLYNHPLIKGISRQGKPSYIPSRSFALALLDIFAPADAAGPKALKDARTAIANLPPENQAKKALLSLVDEAGDNISKARENVEKWFNDAMDRVSGWYKRKIQLITLGVAFVVSVGLNIDTFVIANSLYRDPTVRASVVAAAEQAVKQPSPSDSLSSLTGMGQFQEELEQLRLPMGWSDLRQKPHNPGGWIAKFFGWLFTALAASLGAPFWFDVLSSFINLRSVGKRPKVNT